MSVFGSSILVVDPRTNLYTLPSLPTDAELTAAAALLRAQGRRDQVTNYRALDQAVIAIRQERDAWREHHMIAQ